jgi:ATP-binding cassette, subfamily C, bacterial
MQASPALAEINTLVADAERHSEPEMTAGPDSTLDDALELSGVSVTYPGREAPALDQMSLRLPARATILLTGGSGSGKSTLADLLMGLIEPDADTIRVLRVSQPCDTDSSLRCPSR